MNHPAGYLQLQTNLENANLEHANLEGVNLQSANLKMTRGI